MARHHFVPQFYLRAWKPENRDLFFAYFRDPRGRVQEKDRSSKSVGFEDDLYAVNPDGISPLQNSSEEVERKFFGEIDNDAGVVHEKILSKGIDYLSEEERKSWAVFVYSLLERHPKRIREITSEAGKYVQETLDKMKSCYQEPNSRPSLGAWLDRIDGGVAARNATLWAMMRQIKSEDLIEYICSMQWILLELTQDDQHFLTSDRPVVVNGGSDDRTLYYMSFALNPRRLMIMYQNRTEFGDEFIKMVAASHNFTVVKQAMKYALSSRSVVDTDFIKYRRLIETLLPPGDGG